MSGHRQPIPPVLAGHRGLVLGVSSEDSVGFHAASQFRALGARVAVSSRRTSRDFVPRLTQLGLVSVEVDVTETGSLERGIEQAGRELGGLDFLLHTLVHVPEGALGRSLLELSARELADAMEVGVRSLLVAARAALPLLEASDCPRIVALLSGGADFAMPQYHVVGLTKAALAAAIRYLAAELGPKRILCNAVNFSILETAAARREIGDERTQQTRQHLRKRSLTQSALSYDDVTRAIAFLSSPLCSNMTGEIITVDGGFSRSYF